MTQISLTQNEKIHRWKQEKEIVDKLTDGLSLGIDDGIKETVIALRVLGVNTISSHEGKLDRYPIPYIDIESLKAKDLFKLRNEIIEKLQSEEEKNIFKEVRALWKQIQNTDDVELEKKLKTEAFSLERELGKFSLLYSKELEDLDSMIELENSLEQKKVSRLLELFYTKRVVSEEVVLYLKIKALGTIRLQSKGHATQQAEKDFAKVAERLKAFQAEMTEFTEFLKGIYFEGCEQWEFYGKASFVLKSIL